MSIRPLTCSDCGAECRFNGCAPFPQGQERSYGVAWSCPNGHGDSLDICPIGPLVPTRDSCLNCGHTYADSDNPENPDCRACGLSRADCEASLGLGEMPVDPVAAARTACEKGLFRHGLAIVNSSLAVGPGSVAAWFLKTWFLNAIRFNRSAAEMLEDAIERTTNVEDRILLLEEQSYLWAECQAGVEALQSADTAVASGSNTTRTHYLRGRALALLGRLDESREEMTAVLALQPDHVDAMRGIEMIDAALSKTPRRSWWQFWK